MTTATLSLRELDMESSVIEAASKRVGVVLAQGSLVPILGIGCFYLHRAQRMSAKLRKALSAVEIKTPEHRAIMKDIALNLTQATAALDQGFDEIKKMGVSRVPLFGQKYMTMLEDLAITTEDMAETAALAASAAFGREIRTQFHKNIDSHQRQVRTA